MGWNRAKPTLVRQMAKSRYRNGSNMPFVACRKFTMAPGKRTQHRDGKATENKRLPRKDTGAKNHRCRRSSIFAIRSPENRKGLFLSEKRVKDRLSFAEYPPAFHRRAAL